MQRILFTNSWIVLFVLIFPPSAFSFPEQGIITTPLSNSDSQKAIKSSSTFSGVRVELLTSSIIEHEYLQGLGKDIFTKIENNWRLQSRFDLLSGRYFSIAWQETTITQENDFYGDIDFDISGSGPVAGVGFFLTENIMVTAELRVEEYQEKSKEGFYGLSTAHSSQGSSADYFYSGFIEADISRAGSWTTLSYTRSRDTEPIYDQGANRAVLNIRAEEITGIAMGWLLLPEWEFGGSVFYEKYETGTPDQFNVNIEVAYSPEFVRPVRFSLGSGYYTEEIETIVNFSADYVVRWRYVDLSLEYQCEYSANESSVLHQGDLMLKYSFNKETSFFVRGGYGKEAGGDHDRFSSFSGGLDFLF